jgi:hypothetical protein
MAIKGSSYLLSRPSFITFLESQGFKTHPREVFCPASDHCWVDVAAKKGSDFWAFEYKSRSDSIKRGLEQCTCYAKAFNYVVLVADRKRMTGSTHFGEFKRRGFGIWRHDQSRFYSLVSPVRRMVPRKASRSIERQFRHILSNEPATTTLLNWINISERLNARKSDPGEPPSIQLSASAPPKDCLPLHRDE